MIQALLFNGFTSAYWSARSFGGPYGDWQHYGATHDGPSSGNVHAGGISFVIGLGMAIRPGRDALVRSFDQRLQNLDGNY